ncbi:MAG: hypothetical protein JWN52_7453 [Actinomycetia bacterium]|nr:hypothetical protein [Actinomycetes bacterium]
MAGMGIDMSPELRLLGELCRELAQRGMGVQMRDALPGLTVRTTTPGVYVWVFVSVSGRHFIWRRADSRHSVDDVAGAAQEIVCFVGEQNTLMSDRPSGLAP